MKKLFNFIPKSKKKSLVNSKNSLPIHEEDAPIVVPLSVVQGVVNDVATGSEEIPTGMRQ